MLEVLWLLFGMTCLFLLGSFVWKKNRMMLDILAFSFSIITTACILQEVTGNEQTYLLLAAVSLVLTSSASILTGSLTGGY